MTRKIGKPLSISFEDFNGVIDIGKLTGVKSQLNALQGIRRGIVGFCGASTPIDNGLHFAFVNISVCAVYF